MGIYTKRGDGGETDLFGGGSGGGMRRVAKDALVIEAIGTVDELNSCIGLARAHGPCERVDVILAELQRDLFVLGADLAAPKKIAVRGSDDVPRVSDERVIELEKMIDEFESELPEMRAFILPYGCVVTSALHVARAVCRRAERVCVGVMREVDGAGESDARREHFGLVVRFLNRLSDLLFVMARWEQLQSGGGEMEWKA